MGRDGMNFFCILYCMFSLTCNQSESCLIVSRLIDKKKKRQMIALVSSNNVGELKMLVIWIL